MAQKKLISDRDMFLPNLGKAAIRLRNIREIHKSLLGEIFSDAMKRVLDMELELAVRQWDEETTNFLNWYKEQNISISEFSAVLYECSLILKPKSQLHESD